VNGLALGVDIGGTKMLVVARDPSGALVSETSIPTGPATTGAWLEREIREFGQSLDGDVERVAIAVPGLVADHAEVRSCDVLPRLVGWRPAVDLVINDIRAALASVIDSLDADGPVLCVVAGTAIGAAFTDIGGVDVFDGADGWAGELGYLPMGPAPDGQVQRLDDLAGGSALLTALQLPAGEVHRRLATDDPAVRAGVETAGAALGLGLAACVNLLNPRTLVLGGGTCRFAGYRDAAVRTAEAHSIPELWTSLRVRHFADERRFAADGALAAARKSAAEAVERRGARS